MAPVERSTNSTSAGNDTYPEPRNLSLSPECSSCIYGVSTWPFFDPKPSFGTIIITIVGSVLGIFGILVCACIAYEGYSSVRDKIRKKRMNEDIRRASSVQEVDNNINHQIIYSSDSGNLVSSPSA